MNPLNNPARRLDAAAIAGLAIATAAAYSLLVGPVLTRRAAAGDTLSSLAGARARAGELLDRRATLEARLAEAEQALARSTTTLRSASDQSAKLSDLNAVANESGFSIDALRPGDPEPGPLFGSVAIGIEGHGPAGSVAGFLGLLHRHQQDISVRSLSVTATGGPDQDCTVRVELRWAVAHPSQLDGRQK